MPELYHSLRGENTFRIDVKAKYFAKLEKPSDLKNIIDEVPEGTPLLPLGSGSNILFTKDFDGLVIKNEIKGIEILEETHEHVKLKVGAGEIWHDLVRYCVERNYSGIENLSLIPGTVGAAPIQNIGAYGVELKDVLESVIFIDMDTWETREFTNEECDFGYRDSIFKRSLKNRAFIISIAIKLSRNAKLNTTYAALSSYLYEKNIVPQTVKDISDAVIAIRQSKLPDPAVLGNAGSFFKNPEIPLEQYKALKEKNPSIPGYPVSDAMIKVPAGWLIEQCGWKGLVVGNTGCHKMQALVLVNYGAATGTEVKDHAYKVIDSVNNKFGIRLMPEVNIV